MEGSIIVLEGLRIEEQMWEEEEEEEDTLSLCDLHIYDNDSEECENCYDTKSTSSSFSSSYSSEQDLFEFFSEESSKNNSFSQSHPENIVFCGKIIPYRNPITSESTNKNQIEAKKKQRSEKQSKQSVVSSVSLSKRSWYMFLFGSAGVPTEMELKDLKTRQSRKVIASSSSSSSSSCSTLCRVKNGDDKGRGKGNKGMWRLIKALSCTGGATYHAQSVVKASIGCISLV